MPDDDFDWYGVRCLFRWRSSESGPYEERITLWRARSADEAIELAEREAGEYSDGGRIEFIGFSQSYRIYQEDGIGVGTEVFSLLRDSDLSPVNYIDAFFQTGGEHERMWGDGASGEASNSGLRSDPGCAEDLLLTATAVVSRPSRRGPGRGRGRRSRR
jgi:hypothetical protein